MKDKFPPRAWCVFGSDWIEGVLDQNTPGYPNAYISVEEHNDILEKTNKSILLSAEKDHAHMKEVIESYRSKLEKEEVSAKFYGELSTAYESTIESLEIKLFIYEKALENIATDQNNVLDVVMKAIADGKLIK